MRNALAMAVVLSAAAAFSQRPSFSQRPASSQGPASDEAAFEAVCGACHATSLAKDLRTKSEWIETIDQMVSLGAKGTDDQLDALLRFLLRTRTKINVNAAAASEIAAVLDISDAVAEAVVQRRSEKGNFQSLDDLEKVPGVERAKVEARRDRIDF